MKKITQEDVDKAWEAWNKARNKDWKVQEKARKVRVKAWVKAKELERKFKEQEKK